MPPFRFNAKRTFLTYPQCGDLTKDALLQFLRDDRGAAWYCVSLEQHEDGGNHLHAYAEWLQRLDVRDERYFDLDGCHPNIQSVRNRANVLKYVQKGGDYIGNCEASSSTTVRYGELIANARGADDFLECVVQHYPRDAVLHLERVQQFANWRWREERAPYVPSYTTFDVPVELSEWVGTNLTEVGTLYTPFPPLRLPPPLHLFNPNSRVLTRCSLILTLSRWKTTKPGCHQS